MPALNWDPDSEMGPAIAVGVSGLGVSEIIAWRGWDAALLGLLEAVAHHGEAGGVADEFRNGGRFCNAFLVCVPALDRDRGMTHRSPLNGFSSASR